MAFKLNRENQFKIGASAASLNALAAGVYSWGESASYTTDNTEYYDSDGNTNMSVLSISRDFTFNCHKPDADAAATYVWGKRYATGSACDCVFEWTGTDETVKRWNATIHDIQLAGGDAGAKEGFSFSVHFNSEIDIEG